MPRSSRLWLWHVPATLATVAGVVFAAGFWLALKGGAGAPLGEPPPPPARQGPPRPAGKRLVRVLGEPDPPFDRRQRPLPFARRSERARRGAVGGRGGPRPSRGEPARDSFRASGRKPVRADLRARSLPAVLRRRARDPGRRIARARLERLDRRDRACFSERGRRPRIRPLPGPAGPARLRPLPPESRRLPRDSGSHRPGPAARFISTKY